MQETLLIEDGPFETRAAVIKGDELLDLQIERPGNLSHVGDFFNGRVSKILPDMNIAFIDLGVMDDGLLQLSDIPTNSGSINTAVHEGEKLLVQVIKDAKGEKGLQLGCRFALHGANLIYRPCSKGLTLSKSIKASDKRDRLRSIFQSHTQDCGITVRTSAQFISDEELMAELNALLAEWKEIQAEWTAAKKPGSIGPQKTPLTGVLKNLLTTNLHVIVNNITALNATKGYVARHMPGIQEQITLWDQQTSLFEEMNVEAELERALRKSVPLTSGGSITIEPTEAAVIIDVNSAGQTRASGTHSAALSTNLDAAREICRQIRIRNLSGIIIIDFIQMNGKSEAEHLARTLQDALDKDPIPTRLIGLTELGLMQITRKRGRPALHEILYSPCETCGGSGHVKNEITILSEVYRALQNEVRFSRQTKLLIEVGGKLAPRLQSHQTLLQTELARPLLISINKQLSDFGYKIG